MSKLFAGMWIPSLTNKRARRLARGKQSSGNWMRGRLIGKGIAKQRKEDGSSYRVFDH